MCEIGYCCTLMKTTTAAHSWFDMINSLFFFFRNLVQNKQIVKVLWISTHQTLLRGKTRRFQGFLIVFFCSCTQIQHYTFQSNWLSPPLKTKTVKVRPAVPWYNDDIKAAKRLRHKAERTGHPSRCPPPTQVWGNHLKELSRNRLRIGGPKCSLAWGEALQTLVQKGQPESVPTESCGKNFF